MLKKRLPLFLFSLFSIIFLIVEFNRPADYTVIMLASEAMAAGENIYARTFVYGFKFFNSPLYALLLYPFQSLSIEWVSTLWNALSFILLGRTFFLMPRFFGLQLEFKNKYFIPILVFLACFFPIYANFHSKQLSAFILFALVESLYQIQVKNRKILGASILALAINIKLLPLVLLPYLVFRKEFKATAYLLLFSLLFLLLPSFFIGWDNNLELHAAWFESLDPTKGSNIIDLHERRLHSIGSLIGSLFNDLKNDYELPLRRHILVLDRETLSIIINIIRLLLILLTFLFLRTSLFKKPISRIHHFWEISFLCLVIPLIFPHQQVYAFLLLIPAIYYVVYFLSKIKPISFSKAKKKWIWVLSISCFIIINLEIILGTLRAYFWHFKTLTYGSLLLLLVLYLCHPKHLESQSNK